MGTQAELEHDSWGEPRARGDGRVADMRLRPPVFDRALLAAHPSEPQFPVSHGMMIAAASRRRAGRARRRRPRTEPCSAVGSAVLALGPAGCGPGRRLCTATLCHVAGPRRASVSSPGRRGGGQRVLPGCEEQPGRWPDPARGTWRRVGAGPGSRATLPALPGGPALLPTPVRPSSQPAPPTCSGRPWGARHVSSVAEAPDRSRSWV